MATLTLPADKRAKLTLRPDLARVVKQNVRPPEPPVKPPQPAKKAKAPPPPKRTPEMKAANVAIQAAQRQAAIERQAMRNKVTLYELTQRFPLLFNKAQPVPLAIGIDRALRAVTGWKTSKLGPVLAHWTKHPAYLDALVAGGPRLGIDGQPDGIVSEAQQADAKTKIDQRVAKMSATKTQQ